MKKIQSHRLRAREVLYLKLFYRAILILLLMLFVSYTAEAKMNLDSGSIMVDVSDKNTKELIPFANVVAYQNGVKVEAGTTDMDGRWIRHTIFPDLPVKQLLAKLINEYSTLVFTLSFAMRRLNYIRLFILQRTNCYPIFCLLGKRILEWKRISFILISYNQTHPLQLQDNIPMLAISQAVILR